MSAAMPKVGVYPVCSECEVPYVLRQALFVFTKKMKRAESDVWIWQRDCKHKKAAPKVHP